ncbi:MAG: ribosome biogenesis GTP-binding protein YihA/YsxC [Acidimicrobiales bacterium]
MASPLHFEFLQSARRVDQLPASRIELAVVGRSNVGKSSLINALANRKKLAKTSKSPGATQLLNIFELQPSGSGLWLVDLPGYGFAKAPKSEQNKWKQMIEAYLTKRETLAGVLVLVDGAVGPTALDLQTIDWLQSIDLPYSFVATKSDKVRSTKRAKRRTELTSKLGVAKGDVRWVSAEKGTGIPELRGEILEFFHGD